MSLIGNSYSVLSTRSAANFEKVPSTNNCGERRQTRSLYYIFKITNLVENSVFISDLDLANGASDARTNPGMSANSTHLKIVDFFLFLKCPISTVSFSTFITIFELIVSRIRIFELISCTFYIPFQHLCCTCTS